MFYRFQTDQILNRPRRYFLVLIGVLMLGQTSSSVASEPPVTLFAPRCSDLLPLEPHVSQPPQISPGLTEIYKDLKSTAQKLADITKDLKQPKWMLDIRVDSPSESLWNTHSDNVDFSSYFEEILGHWDGEIISIEFKSKKTSKITRSGWDGKPDYVFAHEFGHAVFQENAKLLETSLTKLSRQEIEFIVDLDDSYDELFADTLAVLYSGDPEAMASKSAHRVHRSFSKKVRLERFSSDINDPHERMDPVRSYLWANFMTGPRKVTPQKLLKMLLSARDAEIDYIFKNREKIDLNNQVLNRRFIEALEKIWIEEV